jgi:PAS domain S-box-containing protein
MEASSATRHDGRSMDAVPSPRHTGTVVALAAVAVLCLLALLTVAPGSHAFAVVRGFATGAALLASGAVVVLSAPGSTWPGAKALGIALIAAGAAGVAFGAAGLLSDTAFAPRTADVVLLGLLAPFILAARAEFAAHFDHPYRREVVADVTVLAIALSAIAYVVVKPVDATTGVAISALTFAILGSTIVAIFGALALWTPSRAHLLLFAGLATLALATTAFGSSWAAGRSEEAAVWIAAAYIVAPCAVAWLLLEVRHDRDRIRVNGSTRIVRPVLTSITVIAASGALSAVAILDDTRGIAGVQSTILLMTLGTAIALRILVNQISSAEAYESLRVALAEGQETVRDMDVALQRVREGNESLRRSEEHLNLIFEAAVDGFVELDHERTVLRANDAFGRMISMDPGSLAGRPWSSVATLVEGADGGFARLVDGAKATLERPDGQVVHIESTSSTIPTDPPLTLLLVRDVTAAKVADQTIRSLFHFLQDRDEDRTRLLRRSNAAIEQERNRIARDLHDGPVQGVSAASLSLEAALLMIKSGDVERGTDVLVKIRQELAGEADALRQLMAGLRPPVLEERGLMPALRETVARFEADSGIVSSFEGDLKRPVPRDVETLAYRVVQESLTNIGKHARATTVTVHLDVDDTQLRVEVEDDGQGFETARMRDYLRSGRVGLASMRERVELASGTFNLRSTPGRGTVVTALIPLDESLLAAPAI